MTMHDNHDMHVPSGGLLGWLGLGRQHARDREKAPLSRTELAREARRHLLQQIMDFLLDTKLEITPHNLAIAHGAYAGLNPGLQRRIRKRLESGRTITQAWLDNATAAQVTDENKAVEELANRLERGIDDLSRSTRTARSATQDYGNALERHMGQLNTAPDEAAIITELAGYARAMLDRSRKAEAELRRSEEEAASLRRNLDRARRDAEVDYLTGLPNRRGFEAALERQYREAQAMLEPLCVAFCDIDLFKAVNDMHGHEAGDRIICLVSETLAGIADANCFIARHGGEEFVILFRGAQADTAFRLLDAARENLAQRRLVNRRTEQPFGQVTFSGGVADVFAYPSPRQALAAADEALYHAKEGGRNRVVLATPPMG